MLLVYRTLESIFIFAPTWPVDFGDCRQRGGDDYNIFFTFTMRSENCIRKMRKPVKILWKCSKTTHLEMF